MADVPDVKTCSAFGDTPEEALREVQEALAGRLAVGPQSTAIRCPSRATGR